MPIDEARTSWEPRIFTRDVLPVLLDELQSRFGSNVTREGDPARHLAEALDALPFDDVEQDFLNLVLQHSPFTATGAHLDARLQPNRRRGAKVASTFVELDWKAIPTAPTPLFTSADLTFSGPGGIIFVPTSDLDPPSKLVDITATGTASQNINTSTRTRIAQRFTLGQDDSYVQAFRFTMTHGAAAPTVKATVETDDGGNPSGTLAHENLTESGIAPDDGTETTAFFDTGAYLDAGDYWLVLEATAGDGTLDGAATGTADQVKSFSAGAWSLEPTVDNLNVEVIEGGIVPVAATLLGDVGNVDAGRIADVSVLNNAAQGRWDTYVGSFTNNTAAEGGRDPETDAEYRRRGRTEAANGPGGNPDALAKLIRDRVVGVRDAVVIENTELDGTADETVYDGSADTGTGSTTIDAATPHIAQRFQATRRTFLQHLALTLAADTAFEGIVRLESDDAGEPGGLLATGTIHRDYAPGGTSRTTVTLEKGAIVETGTDYWLTIERTAGSAQFDGETASGDGNVLTSTDGTNWATDAAVDNLNVEAIGGIPGRGGRVIVLGGAAKDIARAMRGDSSAGRPTGIKLIGSVAGSFVSDVDEQTYTEYFDRPTDVPVVLDVTLLVTSAYPGGTSAVKDILVHYIGGDDSEGVERLGAGINGQVIRHEAIGRLQEGPVPGIRDTLLFRLGRKADFPTPSSLTAAQETNLDATGGERFLIEDLDDVRITIQEV